MDIAVTLRRWLREPLVHFLLAGLAVFAFSAWRGEAVDPASRSIEIDPRQVGALAERFVQTWQRAPSAGELDGLIRDHIKEEVYYREALRLGLEADDATLQRYLDWNVKLYVDGTKYSFDPIYLGEGDAAAVKTQLVRGGDWQTMDTPISLRRSVDDADRTDIAKEFG